MISGSDNLQANQMVKISSKQALAACVTLLASACTPSGGIALPWHLNDVTVIHVGERPPGSGIVATFVQIKIAADNGEDHVNLLPYFGASQEAPMDGQICDFSGFWDELDGLVGEVTELVSSEKVRIISVFDCGAGPVRNPQ